MVAPRWIPYRISETLPSEGPVWTAVDSDTFACNGVEIAFQVLGYFTDFDECAQFCAQQNAEGEQ